jgi:predicted nucleic acid-binding protein
MNVLVDTNLLTRLAQPAHPRYQIAVDALKELRRRGDRVCIVPQIVYEFYVVCTRPKGENGLDLSPAEGAIEIRRLQQMYVLFPEDPEVFTEWTRLVGAHRVSGRPAHDSRLVAAMNVHGIEAILTFNRRDFARYADIILLTPDEVVGQANP